ncbi:MAG: hypothetical protein ACK4FL_01975 [Microgenomates group bacterium]
MEGAVTPEIGAAKPPQAGGSRSEGTSYGVDKTGGSRSAETSFGVEEFLRIVKSRLQKIAQPPPQEDGQQQAKEGDQQKKEDQRRTAQALLNILNGSERPTDSFKTDVEPIKDESSQEAAPAKSENSDSRPEDKTPDEQTPPQKKSELIEYQNPRIKTDEKGKITTITAIYPEENKVVEFSPYDLVRDMALTVGFSPQQADFIGKHLSGQETNLAETARRFGFLTRDDILGIFKIPQTPQERNKVLQNPNLPQWQRQLITAINALPEVPDAGQIIGFLSSAGIPTDKPIEEAIKKIQNYAEELPDEKKSAYEALIIQAQQQLKQLGETEKTLADAIESHYQKLEAGEDISPEATSPIKTLVELEALGKKISEAQKKEILDKVAKLGKTGGTIIALLAILLIVQSSRELSGGRQ